MPTSCLEGVSEENFFFHLITKVRAWSLLDTKIKCFVLADSHGRFGGKKVTRKVI